MEVLQNSLLSLSQPDPSESHQNTDEMSRSKYKPNLFEKNDFITVLTWQVTISVMQVLIFKCAFAEIFQNASSPKFSKFNGTVFFDLTKHV